MLFRAAPRRAALSLVLVLLMMGAGSMLSRQAEWLGWMPAGVNSLERTGHFGASVLAASVAWAASSLRAHRAEDWALIGIRRRSALYREPFVWGLAIAVAVTTILTLAVLALTWRSATPEMYLRLAISVLTLLAFNAFAAGVGVLAGRYVPTFMAVVVAFLVPYVVALALGGYLYSSPVAAWAVPDYRGYQHWWPPMTSSLLRLLLWGAIGGAIWCALAQRRRLARTSLWVGSAAAAAAVFTFSPLVPIPGAIALHCVGDGPRVCVDRTQVTSLARYDELVREGLAAVPERSWPAVITASEQSVPEGAIVAPPTLQVFRPARVVNPESVLPVLGEALFSTQCAAPERGELGAALTLWWRDQHHLPLSGGASIGELTYEQPEWEGARQAAVRLSALDRTTREAFIVDGVERLRDCALPAQPMP